MKKRQSTRAHTSRNPGHVKTIPTPASRAGLAPDLLDKIDAYWRAANYLSVGQIYLFDNPLLKKPLTRKHIKPRLLGHWGTMPGLNFAYVHLNRVIKEQDLSVIFLTGPGHGGPGTVANTWLEGTYSEAATSEATRVMGSDLPPRILRPAGKTCDVTADHVILYPHGAAFRSSEHTPEAGFRRGRNNYRAGHHDGNALLSHRWRS
jgi:hypothetical protein